MEFPWIYPVIVIVFLFLVSAIKVVREYERLVVFRLGRLTKEKGPGLVIIIPIIDKIIKIPLRIVTLDVPAQEVITRDNVTASINAVIYYRVIESSKAVVNVENYRYATAQLAQTTLRSIAGQADLDEILSERDKLNIQVQKILDEATDPWGIKVTAVEMKDVGIPESLQKAISRQATAERERRAIIVQAEGEKQAAVKLSEAAKILSSEEGALFVRTLRTLSEISGKQGSIFAFPFPIELKNFFPSSSIVKESSKEIPDNNK